MDVKEKVDDKKCAVSKQAIAIFKQLRLSQFNNLAIVHAIFDEKFPVDVIAVREYLEDKIKFRVSPILVVITNDLFDKIKPTGGEVNTILLKEALDNKEKIG